MSEPLILLSENNGRDYGKGAGKTPSGALYEPTERINVFRKLFYGVGGLVARRMKAQSLLGVMKSITDKEGKKGLREEYLVELRNPKTSSMFHALAGKQ